MVTVLRLSGEDADTVGAGLVRQVAGFHDPARGRSVAVAEIDGAIVSYVAWVVGPERRNARVTILAVSPRRHHMGSVLCEHAFGAMRELGAEVVTIGTGGDGFTRPPEHRMKCSAAGRPLPGTLT